jgi:DNA mismatch endonuclease (patch repair protein)
MPQNNKGYWQKKITGNVARDKATNHLLSNAGYRVLRIWEHSLRKPDSIAKRINSALNSHT